MAELIYLGLCSVDGYVADESGGWDWAVPDEQVHRFVNDLSRPVGTYLCGRRDYEVMTYWETAHRQPHLPPAEQDFADIWRAADKVVYSRTLDAVSTGRTRLERAFDASTVRRLVDAADRDVSVGGAGLAGQALAAGLVHEIQMLAFPVIVGGGKRFLPAGIRLDLRLSEERRFDNGAVFLRYRTVPA